MATRILAVVRPLAFGLPFVLAVSTAIVGVIQFFRFTSISTQGKKTGAVKREIFFGKPPCREAARSTRSANTSC